MPSPPPALLLLAAGLSRRMGAANKLLLPFGEKTVLETTMEQLEGVAAGQYIAVMGHEAELISPFLSNRPWQGVYNPDYPSGKTSSIKAGVRAARPDCSSFMICLADMPLIRSAEYRVLLDTFEMGRPGDPRIIVQPRFGGQRGNPVLFSAAYRQDLLNLDDPEGARSIVQANREHLLLVDMPTDSVLLDADTPEAYGYLLKRLGGSV